MARRIAVPDEVSATQDVRTARTNVEYNFQGQEAPFVIYSMTTSTHADAPSRYA
jgi:hypothetical protein